jgi:nucleoid-associated protein YgaU
MRSRCVTAAALVAVVALPLGGCRQLEASQSHSKNQSTTKSSKGGATAKSVQKVYVVQSGDTLYGIARSECGDGGSVSTIAKANIGRKQPDGRVFTDQDSIRAGWTLVVSCR